MLRLPTYVFHASTVEISETIYGRRLNFVNHTGYDRTNAKLLFMFTD